MGDLFSGLIRNDLGHNAFYDKYEHLNKVAIPNEGALFKLQLTQLKTLEKSKKKKYKNIETFVKNAQKRMGTLDSEFYNLAEDKIYSRIIELLNTGLWGNKAANPTRRLAEGYITKEQKNREIDSIVNEMKTLLDQMQINQGLSQNIVDTLENRLRHQSGADNKAYVNIKSDFAEALAVEILNKNEGFQAIVSGKLQDSLGQQLIEDAFVFNKKNIDAFFGKMKFEIVNKDGKKTTETATSVSDLLTKINSLSGQYSINLSNPLYDALKKASELDVQVKSGRGSQPIINRAKRNAISLEETGFVCGGLVELYNLQKSPTQYFLPESQQKSKDLEALANYSLSRRIGMTAIASNQLYFTEHGIQTASEWMEENKYMLKFHPGVTNMGKDFMTKKRQYQLRKFG